MGGRDFDKFTRGSRARGQLAAPDLDTFTQGAAPPSGGAAPIEGDATAAFLARKRAGFSEELKDPGTRKLLGAVISSENPGAGPAVAESLMNRTELVNETRARQGLPPLSLKDMMIGKGGGRHSFYGPIRSGAINEHLRKMDDPAYAAAMNKRTDLALAGSHTIGGFTDQGSRGDPNYEAGGTGININKERFNDWGYSGSVAWRHHREQDMAAAARSDATNVASDRQTIDRKSIKTVKVDATGRVAVNIGGGGGNDATLGSSGLFRPTTPERREQMQAAETGPSAAASFQPKPGGAPE
jgi:hypothetical protein